jgi:FtsH-binding integral membrane protein
MTRDSKLMLSRIGMTVGSMAWGMCIVLVDEKHSSVAFVIGMVFYGISLYSWLTNMELSQ